MRCSCWSSSADAARLRRAMSSSPTPCSESTTTLTVWRLPAARTSSSSSSKPAAGHDRFQHAVQLPGQLLGAGGGHRRLLVVGYGTRRGTARGAVRTPRPTDPGGWFARVSRRPHHSAPQAPPHRSVLRRRPGRMRRVGARRQARRRSARSGRRRRSAGRRRRPHRRPQPGPPVGRCSSPSSSLRWRPPGRRPARRRRRLRRARPADRPGRAGPRRRRAGRGRRSPPTPTWPTGSSRCGRRAPSTPPRSTPRSPGSTRSGPPPRPPRHRRTAAPARLRPSPGCGRR